MGSAQEFSWVRVKKKGTFPNKKKLIINYVIVFAITRLLDKTWYIGTLDSGIDVAPGINIAPGTFGKNIKRSP